MPSDKWLADEMAYARNRKELAKQRGDERVMQLWQRREDVIYALIKKRESNG